MMVDDVVADEAEAPDGRILETVDDRRDVVGERFDRSRRKLAADLFCRAFAARICAFAFGCKGLRVEAQFQWT